jgi:hypothetical protein
MALKDTVRGFFVPVRDIAGRTVAKRKKHDPPITIDGKLAKFTLAQGPNDLNFLPLLEGTWSEVNADPSIPVYWCESDFKAAALAAHGLACVTSGSVYGHRTATGTVAGLDSFDWHRKVRFVYDNDLHINTDVQDGLFDAAAEVRERGGHVEAYLLPRPEYDEDGAPIKVGVDDFVHAQGFEAFQALTPLPLTDPAFAKMGKYRSPPKPDVARDLRFRRRPKSVLRKLPPDRDYIIEPIMGRGLLTWLPGVGGMGKGLLTIDMAVHIAVGEPWMGLAVTQGRTLILSLEDSVEEMDRRVYHVVKTFAEQRAYTKRQRQDLRAAVRECVLYESLEGKELKIVTEKDRNIVRTPELHSLARTLRHLDPDLVILDPLSQLHGLDENSNSAGSAIVSALGHIRKETGAALLVPTHTNKDAEKRGGRASMAGMRGASSLPFGARSVFYVEVIEAKSAAEIFAVDMTEAANRFARLSHVKNNYGALAPPIYAVRGDEGIWHPHRPDLIPFREKATPSDFVEMLSRWLRLSGRKVFSRREVTETHRSAVLGNGCGLRVARDMFDTACASGAIRKVQADEVPAAQKVGGGDRFVVAGE